MKRAEFPLFAVLKSIISLSRCPCTAFALLFQKLSRGRRDDYDVLGGKRGADPELGGRHQVTSSLLCTFDLVPPTPCHSAAPSGSHPSAFLGRGGRDLCRNSGGEGGQERRSPSPLISARELAATRARGGCGGGPAALGVSQSSRRLMPPNRRPQSRTAAKTTPSAAEPIAFKGKGRENLHQRGGSACR